MRVARSLDGGVHVVWYDENQGATHVMRRSGDGGATFAAARVVASGFAPSRSPFPFFTWASYPLVATDPADPRRLYVAWSADSGSDQTDVFLTRSIDGGATWGLPIRANDVSAVPRHVFFPALGVDAGGTVRIAWGEDRFDLANAGTLPYDVFVAASGDRGASFATPERVSTVSSDPRSEPIGGNFLGDGFALSASGVALWTDTRNGNADIFAAAADGGAVCGDADRNGAVTVTDGVQTLRAAAELSSACELATCDVDANGRITVADGVSVLRKAADLPVGGTCGPAR